MRRAPLRSAVVPGTTAKVACSGSAAVGNKQNFKLPSEPHDWRAGLQGDIYFKCTGEAPVQAAMASLASVCAEMLPSLEPVMLEYVVSVVVPDADAGALGVDGAHLTGSS